MRDKKKHKERLDTLGRLIGQPIREGMLIKMRDGFFRVRRGRLVRIPDKWVGRPMEMCQKPKKWRVYRLNQRRPSKTPKKVRRRNWGRDPSRVPREKVDRSPCGRNSYGYDAVPSPRMSHPRNRAPRHLTRRQRRGIRGYEDDDI